ncbi:MAG: IS3 family transposase [Vulcanimicrobiaceae bacterium]
MAHVGTGRIELAMRRGSEPSRRGRHDELADVGGYRASAALYKAASAQEKPKLPTPRGPRPTSISDERLLTEIRTIATEHAAWGHRKVWAMLRRRAILVARRRVWKLMHEAQLTFAPNARRCEPRRGTVVVPMPNRRWSTDRLSITAAAQSSRSA